MKYINKYADLAAYTADTNRPTEAKTVSKVGADLRYEGKNIILPLSAAEKGDTIVYDKNDLKNKVVKLDSLNTATLGSNFVIGGTTAWRDEKFVYMLANNNVAGTHQWSAPYRVKVSGFDFATGGSFTITVNSTTTGAVTYTTSDTLSSVAIAMMAALQAAGFTSATGWSVTAYADCVVVQQNWYTPHVTIFNITDTASKVVRVVLTGNYQTALTGVLTPYSFIRRVDGVETSFAGINLERFYAEYSASGGTETNQAVGAATIVRESVFNSTDNPLLVAYYGTYRNYLSAKMARYPFSKGAIIDRNRKLNTDLLAAITWTDYDGCVKPAHPAAYAAKTYGITTAGHTTGFEAGNWWLPSVDEMRMLIKDVTMGLSGITAANADAINRGINAAGGTMISVTTNYWTSAEYTSYTAWFYRSIGLLDYITKYHSRYVMPLSALPI